MFSFLVVLLYRRLPNLRDKLTNATLIYTHTHTHTHTPPPPTTESRTKPYLPVCTRLGKCTYCPLIKKKGTVQCNFTHKLFNTQNLPKHFSCEITNVIYLITCSKCSKHYVGETSRAFRQRMYEHRHSVQKADKIDTPVSRHFTSEGHNHKNMQFSVLEWCTPKFEASNTSKRRRIELS